MRVGIIGGGAAGLAAGYELVLQGHQVAVFERAPFWGGQAATFDVGGARLERGYHHLFVSDRDMVNLHQELGLGHKLRWIPSRVGIFCAGRVWRFGSPLDLLRFKPLPPLGRVRLGLATVRLQRRKKWHDLEQWTAAEWVQRRVGKAPYDVVLGPLLRGKFGEYYDKVSMAWLWNKFALRVGSRKGLFQREHLGYPMGSFGEVFDTTAQRIQAAGSQVYTSATVMRVVVEDGRAAGLEVSVGGEGQKVWPFDAVIATVPSYIFPKLIPPIDPGYMEKLTSVHYLAAVLLVLVMDRPLSSVYWMSIADRSIPFVGLIEHTNFVEPEHYGGNHILYISNYLSKENPLYHKKREELLEEYLPHLQKINPSFSPGWIREYYYHREEAAQPVVTVNYSQRIPDHHTPIKGLYLANTTQIYPEDRGTNYSVQMGRKVARMLLEDWGGR